MDKFSLKLSELKKRISSIEDEINTEEEHYRLAVCENPFSEKLQDIKDYINFLKRKLALYTQAEQMRRG